MNIRELICELTQEDDMDSDVYVRVIDEHNEVAFYRVDGLAVSKNAFCETHTTLELEL